MWKYVSRRFKDTVERTYNVLDVRRTWTCGVTNDNCNDKKKNSSVPPKCDLPSTVIANTDFSEKYSQNDSENSSSSGDEKRTFNFNHGTNTSKFCPLDCIGALYWSGTLLFGWYTSQLLSLKYRRQALGVEWRLQPREAFNKEIAKRYYPHSYTDYVAKTRIYQRSEVPLHTNQNKALYTNQNEEGDFHQKYYKAVPINNDDRKTTSVFPENDKTPSTSDAPDQNSQNAVEVLLSTLRSIEFKLGLHSLAAQEHETAVSHFKLATSHHHPGATFNLGLCYELGIGVKKDLNSAMRYYRAASALGHSKAMYNLGVFYVHGLGGLNKDRRAARACFTAAKKMGLKTAQKALDMPKEWPRVDDEVSMKSNKILINDVIDKLSVAVG